MRVTYLTSLMMTALIAVSPAQAKTGYVPPSLKAADNEREAKFKLAKILLKVGQSNSMKAAQFKESGASKGQTDQDTGNSSLAVIAYHTYVVPWCQQWASEQRDLCAKWGLPGVSHHAKEKDRSNLEAYMGQHAETQDPNQVWDIQAKEGASVIDPFDGKMDKSAIANYKLKKQLSQGIEQIGYDAASKEINKLTTDENAPKDSSDDRLPNNEGLRYMAGRWTRMLRNHLVAMLGHNRIGKKGTEFVGTEDIAECDQYVKRAMGLPEELQEPGFERLEFQAQLDPETVGDLEQRYQQCVALKRANINMVNPTVEGDQVKEGDPNEEWADEKMYRAMIASIDNGGISPGELQSIAGMQLTKEQVTSIRGDWNNGGQEMKEITETNGQTIQAFNREQQKAAASMKAAAQKSTNINDTGSNFPKVEIGTNLIELNGFTPEMKGELKGTNFPNLDSQKRTPANTLEQSPAELTVTAIGQ